MPRNLKKRGENDTDLDDYKSTRLWITKRKRCIQEIGEENLVQVITDNGSNYAFVGKTLEEKKPNIYWIPCTAHCIDMMIEDIGKLPLINKTIRRGQDNQNGNQSCWVYL